MPPGALGKSALAMFLSMNFGKVVPLYTGALLMICSSLLDLPYQYAPMLGRKVFGRVDCDAERYLTG